MVSRISMITKWVKAHGFGPGGHISGSATAMSRKAGKNRCAMSDPPGLNINVTSDPRAPEWRVVSSINCCWLKHSPVHEWFISARFYQDCQSDHFINKYSNPLQLVGFLDTGCFLGHVAIPKLLLALPKLIPWVGPGAFSTRGKSSQTCQLCTMDYGSKPVGSKAMAHGWWCSTNLAMDQYESTN